VTWILAGDIGTTTLKLGAVTPDGRVHGLVRHEYDLDTPAAGRVELGPDVYWSFFHRGVKQLLAEAGVDPDALCAIAFSSQASTFLLRDAAGEPLGPFTVWLDDRAGAEAAEIQDRFGIDDIYRRTGHTQLSGMLAVAKLLWLARHAPESFSAARRVFFAEDDLIFRLTGEHATDPVLAGASGLYDMRHDAWWPEMVEFVGLRAEQLPRVVPAGQVVGTVLPEVAGMLGLPEGVPVVSGTNDQLAGGISAGNVAPGVVTETTGTALAVVTTTEGPVEGLADGVPFWGHPAPGKFAVLVYANTATILLKWFRQQFCVEMSYEEIMAEAMRVPIGSEGVTVFPHFAGTTYPDFLTSVRGQVAGLGLNHTKFHLARAIVESLTFLLKDLVDFAARAAPPAEVIRSLGGAARSDDWLQMKADVLGIPVEKCDCQENALLGAAMLASLGAGLHPDLPSAATAMVRVAQRFTPNPAYRDPYDHAYHRYRRLHEQVTAAGRAPTF